jgi:hypothetical protein
VPPSQSEISGSATLDKFSRYNYIYVRMLGFVDVGFGCESGYDEVSYGVPLYGRHIILGEHTKAVTCRK